MFSAAALVWLLPARYGKHKNMNKKNIHEKASASQNPRTVFNYKRNADICDKLRGASDKFSAEWSTQDIINAWEHGCEPYQPQRHRDYELYPPAATSHRLGWMITVNGILQDSIYPNKQQAEGAAILESKAQKQEQYP